jgi:threonine/homoserine/homoserine lactone efflux protein
MTVPQALLSFALVAGLLTIIPGLDTSLVLRSSLVRGRAYAFGAAGGILTGSLIWGVAAATGASALLAASELAYDLLTWAGAAYMIGLGARMIWQSFQPQKAQDAGAVVEPSKRSVGGAWLVGTGTNLLNPKVGVFYLATIPQFIPAGTSPLLMGLLLAAVHCLLGLAWFTIIIFGTGFTARWVRNTRAVRIIDRITGGVMIAFGGKLATSPH